MSFSNANANVTPNTQITSNVKRGGSMACTPFKSASNTNTAIANGQVQANAVRKPGLKVVTHVPALPSSSVTASSVPSGGTTSSSSNPPSISTTAYSSDEENVRPTQGQEPHQTQAPLSPQLKDRERERDVRAYEHERQRTKRAGEWAVRRARKTGLGGKTKVQVDGAHASVDGRKRDVHRRADVGVDVDGEYVLGGVGVGRVPGSPPRLCPATASLTASKRAGGLERALAAASTTMVGTTGEETRLDVSLSDLVVPSRSAKSKARTRTATGEDFEWIPAVKAVIALDEVEFGRRDMEVDEPWECVGDAEAEERAKAKAKGRELSYAEVLVGMQVE